MRRSALAGPAAGAQIDPFRLEAVFGEVALKVLKSELADETWRRRFDHEVRAAGAVRHRHVVPILDAGEVDGMHFLAAPLIEGRSLDQRIQMDGPLAAADILELARDIGAALDAVHAHGLVHRDVKPSNILVDAAGDYLLADLGLVRGPGYTNLTRPGQVMGTVDYLAPEVIRGGPASPASDLYALGCVIFESAVGVPPFPRKGVFEVCFAHLEEEPPDPCDNRSDLPPSFSWVVLQALDKDPTCRPPSGVAFATMLQATVEGGEA
jgi:serine/threonine-protein kinase